MTQSQSNRITLLQSYLSDDQQNPFLHFALAKEYEKEAKYDLALKSFLHLTTEHAAYVGTYYHLGKLYEKMAEVTKAIETYTLGIEIAQAEGDQHAASELRAALDLL